MPSRSLAGLEAGHGSHLVLDIPDQPLIRSSKESLKNMNKFEQKVNLLKMEMMDMDAK